MNLSRNINIVQIVLLAGILWLFPYDETVAQNNQSGDFRRLTSSPGELISISSTLPFDKAVEALNELSRRYENKVIIDPDSRKSAIGVDIVNKHWRDALELLLRANNLVWIAGKDYYLIKPPETAIEEVKISDEKLMFENREVIISVLFFELNASKLSQLGMSWDYLSDDGDQVSFTGADEKVGLFQVDLKENFDIGEITATLKALANNQMGDMLASPQITVRSGKEGRIQIGSDFSVTTKDFAGNSVTQFFSTGSIITVTPLIMTIDTVTFIHLDLEVQKSNANNSELGIEVKKTSAQTSILLLNGEETMIGGLFHNEASEIREGIPILKDLPWWVFGIRYLTGYSTTSNLRKELIVILRAELLPSLKDRLVARRAKVKDAKVLEQSLQNFDRRFENYLEQSRERIK